MTDWRKHGTVEATARRLAVCGAGIAVLAAVHTWRRYRAELATHHRRVRSGSRVMGAPFGQVEYATAGAGPAVLVMHGAGGGFDQAISAATRLIGAGFRVIAPSRFGYLRSHGSTHATLGDQADAYALLLDELGMEKAAVIGVSVGALSALEFAVRHQHRCSSLIVIVPAASAAGAAFPPQGRRPEQGRLAGAVVERVLGSDLLYWLGITFARDRMIRQVLGVDPGLVADADPGERQRALHVLRDILPVSARTQGFVTDTRFVSAPQSIAIERISVPTLVVAIEDDYYRTAAPAHLIAASIPDGRLLSYPTGGHVWVGHDAELFAEVADFLAANRAG